MSSNTLSNNIIRIVSAAMLVTQLVCYKLWTAHLGFPSMPVAGIFGGWPEWVHLVLFGGSLLLMLATVFTPLRSVVGTLLILQIIICLADQNRWQPWQYQYIFMLGTWLFVRDEARQRWGWQFILIGTYFFSALWKFNSAFIYEVWLGFILKRWLHIYDIPAWAFRAGYLLPLAEMAAVFLLCFNYLRRLAMWMLMGMHLFVLLLMGPLGLNVNTVLWPWNLANIFLLFMLFDKKRIAWHREQLLTGFNLLILLCWGVLPWLQAGKKWDRYLSSVLFSGGAPYLFISTDNTVAKKELKPYFYNNCDLPYGRAVNTYMWGQQEMHSTPYPEERSFKNIARAWQKKYKDSTARFIVIRGGFQPAYEEIKPTETREE